MRPGDLRFGLRVSFSRAEVMVLELSLILVPPRIWCLAGGCNVKGWTPCKWHAKCFIIVFVFVWLSCSFYFLFIPVFFLYAALEGEVQQKATPKENHQRCRSNACNCECTVHLQAAAQNCNWGERVLEISCHATVQVKFQYQTL